MAIKIGSKFLDQASEAFVVAEISGNHGGDLQNAIELVRAAKKAGAHAVKLQTYTADTITLQSSRPDFRLPKSSPWADHRTLWDLYNEAHTPWHWHPKLFKEAENLGLLYFSSPFDHSAVEFLEKFNVCAYKIASPEITDLPLLEKVASTGKPVIVSTGLATHADIELALTTLRSAGAQDIVLLKCTTAYPTPFEDLNLKSMEKLRDEFKVQVGLSDHSLGVVAPIMAVSYGAVLIEKHIKLDDGDHTVDGHFSTGVSEFAHMCKSLKEAHLARGNGGFEIPESAASSLTGRRSLYVVDNVKKGELFTKKNVRSIRPAHGLHPKYYKEILGRAATKNLVSGDALDWDCVN